MSRHDKLSKVARRQIEQVGLASGEAFIASRADIYRASHALLEDLGFEPDVHETLSVAEFLAGDTINE